MHPEEFKTKIFPLKNKLYRFARWLIHDDDQAEDFVQEVFLKLWTMKEALAKYQNLEALAMKMIKNKCLNELKKNKEFTSDRFENTLITLLPSPFEKMVMDDKMALIEKILHALPPQQRMVVQLRDVEGYSIEEIASITEVTENNVWVILSRARKNIRDAYLKFESNEQRRYR